MPYSILHHGIHFICKSKRQSKNKVAQKALWVNCAWVAVSCLLCWMLLVLALHHLRVYILYVLMHLNFLCVFFSFLFFGCPTNGKNMFIWDILHVFVRYIYIYFFENGEAGTKEPERERELFLSSSNNNGAITGKSNWQWHCQRKYYTDSEICWIYSFSSSAFASYFTFSVSSSDFSLCTVCVYLHLVKKIWTACF